MAVEAVLYDVFIVHVDVAMTVNWRNIVKPYFQASSTCFVVLHSLIYTHLYLKLVNGEECNLEKYPNFDIIK